MYYKHGGVIKNVLYPSSVTTRYIIQFFLEVSSSCELLANCVFDLIYFYLLTQGFIYLDSVSLAARG